MGLIGATPQFCAALQYNNANRGVKKANPKTAGAGCPAKGFGRSQFA
jgi:hypothetical protein